MSLKERFRQAKRIKLNSSAKGRIKENLIHFIQKNPVQGQVKIEGFSFARMFLKYKHVPALIVLIIILSAGTVYAAEGALPGDPLYVVKTAINEEVQEFLRFSKEAKYHFQVEIIEERLREYERLASMGRLDSEKQASLESLINLGFSKMDSYFPKIASSSAYSTQVQLYNQLSAHKEVIKGMIENFENMENLSSVLSQLQLIESKLKPALEFVKEVKSLEDIPEIEARIQFRNNKISEDISGKAEFLHQRAIEDINRELSKSQNDLREGSILSERGDGDGARGLLIESEQATERAERILKIQEELDIKKSLEKGFIAEKKLQDNEEEHKESSSSSENNADNQAIEEVEEIIEELDDALDPLGL